MLKQSSLHALLMVTSKALSRSGFGDVQILDRRHSKQKSRFGGHELLCQTNVGTVPLRIIVKVINDAVRVRMLDELAGAAIRTKADLGLLVTPFDRTSKSVRKQGRYGGVHLEVLDGPALCGLLRKYGIGVRPTGGVDYAFFAGLESVSIRLRMFLREEGM